MFSWYGTRTMNLDTDSSKSYESRLYEYSKIRNHCNTREEAEKYLVMYVQEKKDISEFENLTEITRKNAEDIAKMYSNTELPEFDKCKRCKSTNVYSYEKQTRSADEGATRFYECINCGLKWRV
jgi:DNA-directed RNA polymerase subunit M/transcription elongation factor TFIIS